ncbi:DUF4395 domain-containing protein [Streptomyces sp. B1866]|uniref:DUF4395 domain-containing protein n=1 Tax=Streptomyces sp. B1866 TaxID=3075431 RepID=UPI0028917C2B|nr:DUF4395 domain-containing protein [Streptomyces sp. B1866]MDT3399020.1 DUF4395 domain-containing protein [Streptomyces sp. B1866]
MSADHVTTAPGRDLVDVRGPRFAAALTSAVLAAVLVTGNPWPLAAQAAVFAAGAADPRWSPYGWLFRVAVRPRLGPAREFEDVRPPRFAQAVGLAFAAVGLVGYAAGPQWLGVAATGLALAAAFLNAAFGYCLGCEMHLALRRAAG